MSNSADVNQEEQAPEPRPTLTAAVRHRRGDQAFFLRLGDIIQQNRKALDRLGT